jgi:hypothetical protein
VDPDSNASVESDMHDEKKNSPRHSPEAGTEIDCKVEKTNKNWAIGHMKMQ